MAIEKPLVFISHITEEKEIAMAFKELIESSFLGMLEVFVSSDDDTIHMGQRWLDRISNGLKNCAIEIIICSPKSILRPWINFEAGAGWVRDIPVIPLCHSGINPSKLPMPLNLLQAAKANEISSLKLIFPVLATAIGAKTPNIDFSEFVEKVAEYESKYTFWDACNSAFEKIHNLNNSIIKNLKDGHIISLKMSETDINFLQGAMTFLKSHNILSLDTTNGVEVGPRGTTYGRTLTPMPELSRIINNIYFKF